MEANAEIFNGKKVVSISLLFFVKDITEATFVKVEGKGADEDEISLLSRTYNWIENEVPVRVNLKN